MRGRAVLSGTVIAVVSLSALTYVTSADAAAKPIDLVAGKGSLRHIGEAVATQVAKPAPTTTTTTAPPQSFPGSSSPNWAGYVLSGQSGGYHGVSGEWTVPTIACGPVPDGNTADWVGVNGFSATSPGLFQDGTISQCDNGQQLDVAWWTDEAQNYASIPVFSVSPGDLIEAEVFREPAGSWAYYISDLTTGAMSSSVTPFAGPGTTAEWIAEDPSYTSSGPLYPLADFGTVTFSDLGLNTPGEKWPAPPPSDAVEMVQPGGQVEALPSPLHETQGGVGFTVSYEAPGQMDLSRAQPAPESQTTSVPRAALPGRGAEVAP